MVMLIFVGFLVILKMARWWGGRVAKLNTKIPLIIKDCLALEWLSLDNFFFFQLTEE